MHTHRLVYFRDITESKAQRQEQKSKSFLYCYWLCCSWKVRLLIETVIEMKRKCIISVKTTESRSDTSCVLLITFRTVFGGKTTLSCQRIQKTGNLTAFLLVKHFVKYRMCWSFNQSTIFKVNLTMPSEKISWPFLASYLLQHLIFASNQKSA